MSFLYTFSAGRLYTNIPFQSINILKTNLTLTLFNQIRILFLKNPPYCYQFLSVYGKNKRGSSPSSYFLQLNNEKVLGIYVFMHLHNTTKKLYF